MQTQPQPRPLLKLELIIKIAHIKDIKSEEGIEAITLRHNNVFGSFHVTHEVQTFGAGPGTPGNKQPYCSHL